MIKVDYQYIETLKRIHEQGINTPDRTSVGESKQIFANMVRFDTQDRYAPFLQVRQFAPRIAFEEWQWMMKGSTDVRELQQKNIHIWNGNSTREFLDSRGLTGVPENHIGKAYGYQYRNFGGVVDQIERLFNGLKSNPTGRRHVVSIWNPVELSEMALEPCFHLYEFMVSGETLNVYFHGRSSDWVFGAPYNLAFAYFWLLTFSRALGYKTGEIVMSTTNTHYYKNQQVLVDEMLKSDHWQDLSTPQVKLLKSVETLDDILCLNFSDFEISNFVRGPSLTDVKIEMAV